MQQMILVFHVLFAVSMVSLILLQHGKGADVGAAFGSGSSNTMFGSAGSLPFLMKITALLAAGFFVTSLSLAYLASHEQRQAKTQMSVPTVPSSQTGGSQKAPQPSLPKW